MAAMPKKRKMPSLLFGAGDVSGWTPVGVSGFRGLKPTAAVRELIQNGLDAATSAEVTPARMRFRVDQHRASDIPAFDSYRKAFEGAQETQRKFFKDELPDNAKAITSDIKQCLENDTCEVLYVLDNGIGLDKNRMCALLGDGLSVKESGATGSFGNGHVVVFPASDLRYILYGGLSNGNMIGSGHAILASRENEKGGPVLSKDGYFVKALQAHDLFDRYVFPENEEIPSLIQDQLLWIKEQWSRGSVVAVIGFNHFRETDGDTGGIREQVFRAAACNFFEAIHGGHLIVEIEEGAKVACLDKENLHMVLEEYRVQKRSTDSFLSGSRAYEALLTLETGKSVKVKTEMGDMEIKLRYPIDEGITRVDLCRNGMWITDRLPKFQNQFGELQAFHCVLPLRKNIVVNRLVRKTEGPLHNSLLLNQLSKEEKKKLNNVFHSIREKLHDEVPKLSNEIFRPDDIFLVRTGELVQGGTKPSTTGTPTIVIRRPKSPDDTGGGGGGHGKINGEGSGSRPAGSFKRSGNQMPFQAVVVPTGNRSCRANIVSGERVSGSEIRFVLDESIDVTSDDVSKESFVHLHEDTLLLNGQPVQESQLRKDENGNVLGVLLGNLDQRQECVIDMDYIVPDDLPVRNDNQVVLKIEMIRRAPQSK